MPLPEEHSRKYWYLLISLQQVPLPEPPSHCACGRDRRRRPKMTPCTYLAKKFPLRCNSCCFWCLCHWRCSCCCYCCCCCCCWYSCCWWPKMIPCSCNAKEFPLKFVLEPQVLMLLSFLLVVVCVGLFFCVCLIVVYTLLCARPSWSNELWALFMKGKRF